jgi:hypothetical protein
MEEQDFFTPRSMRDGSGRGDELALSERQKAATLSE